MKLSREQGDTKTDLRSDKVESRGALFVLCELDGKFSHFFLSPINRCPTRKVLGEFDLNRPLGSTKIYFGEHQKK